MNKIINCILLISILGMNSCQKKTTELWIASGAGYKKPLLEISEKFNNKYGINVNPIFGNMQVVSTQVKQSGSVGILIGDKKFLQNKTLGLEYHQYTLLGIGRLVLAYPKKLEKRKLEDLLKIDIARISIPDPTKAIYGNAAMEFLKNINYYEKIKDKILISSTVPQVSSYLISGEIDAGFINLTDAIGIVNEIGGYIILDDNYSQIEIVAGTVKGFENDEVTELFLNYLSGNECKEILKKYGLL